MEVGVASERGRGDGLQKRFGGVGGGFEWIRHNPNLPQRQIILKQAKWSDLHVNYICMMMTTHTEVVFLQKYEMKYQACFAVFLFVISVKIHTFFDSNVQIHKSRWYKV